jgi:hypothetical protein
VSYTCAPEAVMFGETLDVFCNDSVAGNSNSQTTIVTFNIDAFHGTGSYTLDKSGSGLLLNFTLDDKLFDIAKPEPGVPGSSCTIEADGPATPTKGDTVSGTIHGDDLVAIPMHSPDGQYAPQERGVAMDATFTAILGM